MKYNDIFKNVKMKYDMLYICILNFQTLSKKFFFDWILNSGFDEFIKIYGDNISDWNIKRIDFLDEIFWKMIFLTKKFEKWFSWRKNLKFPFFLKIENSHFSWKNGISLRKECFLLEKGWDDGWWVCDGWKGDKSGQNESIWWLWNEMGWFLEIWIGWLEMKNKSKFGAWV